MRGEKEVEKFVTANFLSDGQTKRELASVSVCVSIFRYPRETVKS